MFFQCPATDYAQSLIIMHNYLMIFLFGIGIFVAVIMGYVVYACAFRQPRANDQTQTISYNIFDYYKIHNMNYNNINVNRTSFQYNKPNYFIALENNAFDYINTEKDYRFSWLIASFFSSIEFIENITTNATRLFFNKDVKLSFELPSLKAFNAFSNLDKDFYNIAIYNNYYKWQYYKDISFNDMSWFQNLLNVYFSKNIHSQQKQFNGLIIEPLMSNNTNSFLSWENVRHSTKLEVVWTLIPTLILFFVAVPSFSLLYGYDEPIDMPVITLKVIGHQWYWSYEYSDYSRSVQMGKSVSFDSYMVHEDDFTSNSEYRLLETDTHVILPVGATIRVLITSGDVLHSWAVPSLGTKTDAIPGRLNQALLLITRPGTFFGQCSELCGVQHGFMPIVIDAVKLTDYFTFLNLFYTK